MYKVFLVDDEIVVRHGIRDCINWESTNFIFSGEAADGELALSLIQEMKPDILITDIKMPFMDGLQLCQIVRKNMPWVKIIILSGHDEFCYAREAMRMGVAEYLLKPVTSEDLLETLYKVELQIEKEKKERENAERIKRQLAQNTPLLRDRFLNELLLGLIPPVEVIERCASLNINIISKYYAVLIIEAQIFGGNPAEEQYSEIKKAEALIDGVLLRDRKVIKFRKNLGEVILIVKGECAEGLETEAHCLAQTIKLEVEEKTTCILGICIGGVSERIKGITESYREAEEIKSYRCIFGKHKILSMDHIKSHTSEKKEFVDICKNDVNDFLKCGLKSDVGFFVNQYIDNLIRVEMKSLLYIYYIYLDMVMNAARFVNELGGEIEQIIPWVLNLENLVAGIDSIEKFARLAEDTLIRVLEFRDSRVEKKYDGIINKAKEYINNNYFNSDISLNTVSSFVNVSPSHFSTIFSQETGENFIEYLTKVRVKKAKELLKTTSLKSTEIAYNVGYNDPHYFSYIFKKAIGITPKEYRNGA